MSKVTESKDVPQYFEVIPDFATFMKNEGQTMEFPLSISQLAKAAQTTVHTVRNYVMENLVLCPEHSASGFGLYDQCALNRLRFIRAAGLRLLDIKPLLYAMNEGDRQACEATLCELQTKIDERQAYLQALDLQLSDLRQQVCSPK